MRALLTGGHGFVARWLREHLEAEGDEIVGAADSEVDVTDGEALRSWIADAAPDAIYHLAALTHVGESWDAPAETFRVNAIGTVLVLEAARATAAKQPTVLVVSSAEVYGTVSPDQMPITEDLPPRPVTPYAASKVAAELVALQAHLGYGSPVVTTRAFNHVGPGQNPSFLVPALAQRIVEAETTGANTIRIGNLSARRDMTDVRDVVRAYRALVVAGEPGETYNVCSGRDVAVEDIARRLVELSGLDLELVVDPELVRPVEVPVMRGDPGKITRRTGWTPEIPLDDTLRDVLASAREREQAAREGPLVRGGF
jgi:GDP-4-dehydro-6-deoxy-D-mannose reductase